MAYNRTPIESKKARIPFVLGTFLITALYIIHAAVDSVNFSEMLISQRGRDIVFILRRPRVRRLVAASTGTQVVMSILGNGILLYRCYVICRAYHPWTATLPAALIYVASIVTSILYLISQASLSGFSRLGGIAGNTVWGTAWFFLSVAVNLLITASISYNLIKTQRRLASALGEHRVRVYTDIVAILVESALPFSVQGIVAGVAKAIGYDGSDALNEAWFAFCALSPQLIIFRVMTGRAWVTDLETSPTNDLSQPIAFAKDSSEVQPKTSAIPADSALEAEHRKS
ncbi:hypothetical protein H1R20_g13909, partial [Candolleomyces eurysporus]